MEYIALGCMTGTSLDGIDCSLIKSDGILGVKEISNNFTPYSSAIKKELLKIMKYNYLDNLEIFKLLNKEYQSAINKFISKNNTKIDVIGIHGQTIFHDPSIKISIQLYDKKLKYNTPAPIICNFRKNDILNGGSGAPIIPIYHQIIANQLKIDSSIFINIGGVTNITLIEDNKISAGDSSYGNALINDILNLKTNYDFDLNGNLSKSGKIINSLYDKLLNDKYFKKKLPKSLDRNYFHQYFKDFKDKFPIEDVLYTLLSVIPESINRIIDSKKKYKIILMGGGRKNLTLLKLFQSKFNDVSLVDDYNLDGDFIESQGMGLLAIRYLNKISSTYKSTTGVSKNIYLGEMC
tara:strand:+ start:85 stop:1134 length:1050 start_codon:yes stop_codon:yes gene_type:complete